MTDQEGLRDLHKLIGEAGKIFAESYRCVEKTHDTEMSQNLLKIMWSSARAIEVAIDSIRDIEDVDTGGVPADGLQVEYCEIAQHLENALELAKDLVLNAEHQNQYYTEKYTQERNLE